MRLPIARAIPILALSALVLACFGRLVAHPGHLVVDGDRPSVDAFQKIEPRRLGNDLTNLFLPHHARIAARVALGRLPSAWDSGGFCGRPMVGNPQAGLFYPPVWLAWWSGRPSALGWLTVGHLIFGGMGVFMLSRRLGSGRFASGIASGVFATSPYVLAQVFEGHYPHVWGACWSPWAFLAADRLRSRDLPGVFALPPILALSALTGHPQEAYYTAITIGAWLVGDAARSQYRGEGLRSIGPLAAWAGILALTLGLVAVELVPDAEAARWGRSGDRLTLIEAGKYHVDSLNLAQIFGPGALGGPADYFGRENYWETVLSIGWAPIVLAAVGFRHFRARCAAKGWALLAILAVVFAGGWKFGLFAAFYEVVPGMDRFRVPARSLFLASLAGSILAGFGVEALRSGAIGMAGLDWPRQRRRLLILGLAIGIGSAVATTRALGDRPAAPARLGEVDRWARAADRLIRDPATWLAIGGSAAAVAWLHRRPWDGRRVALGLGAIAWIELAWHGSGLLRTADPGRFLGPDLVARAIAADGVEGPIRVRARDGFYTDWKAQAAGLEKTNLNDAFQVGAAADLYEALYPIFGPFRSVIDRGAMAEEVRDFRRSVRQAVLDRLGVAYLITDRRPPGASWPVVASGAWGEDRFTVYRNPTAVPRAYVVPRAVPIGEGGSVLSAFLRVDPREGVLLNSDPIGAIGPRQPFRAAEYRSDDPDRVVVSVETEAPGLLVVADTWMPGWSALIDGEPVAILRGNHAQRVIPILRPGRHRVKMRYRAPGFAAGLAISGASAVAWLLLAGFVLARSRRPNPSRPSRVRADRPIEYSRTSRTSCGYSRSS